MVEVAAAAELALHRDGRTRRGDDGVGVREVVVGLALAGAVDELGAAAHVAAVARGAVVVVARLAVLENIVAAGRAHHGELVDAAAVEGAVEADEVVARLASAKRDVLVAAVAALVEAARARALVAARQDVDRGVVRAVGAHVKVPELPFGHVHAEEAVVARELAPRAVREVAEVVGEAARVEAVVARAGEQRHRARAALGERERGHRRVGASVGALEEERLVEDVAAREGERTQEP